MQVAPPSAVPAAAASAPGRAYIAALDLDYDSTPIREMPRGVERRAAAAAALDSAERGALALVSPRLDDLRREGLVIDWRLLPRTGTLLVTTPESRSAAAWQALRGVAGLGAIVRDDDAAQPPPAPEAARPAAIAGELPWHLKAVSAADAWEAGAQGQGIAIGFVDSGAELSHPMLRGRFRGVETGAERSWIDLLDRQPGVRDTYGHGTTVTSVAVGSGDEGTTGPAPLATFVSARSFGRAPGGRPGTLATKLAGIGWMVAPTLADGSSPDPSAAPDVVNLSFGEAATKAGVFGTALRALEDAGTVVVAAAGNGGRRGAGSILSPAVLDTVLAVGMTNRDGEVDERSARHTPSSPSRGTKPDLVAPGVGVTAATMEGGYVEATGTSIASAVVAGAAAVVLSAAPHLVPAQVRDVLRRSAVDVGAPGTDPVAGAGSLDLAAAVRLARTIPKETE